MKILQLIWVAFYFRNAISRPGAGGGPPPPGGGPGKGPPGAGGGPPPPGGGPGKGPPGGGKGGGKGGVTTTTSSMTTTTTKLKCNTGVKVQLLLHRAHLFNCVKQLSFFPA